MLKVQQDSVARLSHISHKQTNNNSYHYCQLVNKINFAETFRINGGDCEETRRTTFNAVDACRTPMLWLTLGV